MSEEYFDIDIVEVEKEKTVYKEKSTSPTTKSKIQFGKSVLRHPDKDELIEKLKGGHSPKSIAKELKLKYDDKDLYISWLTLDRFRKNYLNLRGKALQQIQREKREREAKEKAIEKSNKECNSIEVVEKRQVAINKAMDIAESIDYTRRLIESRIKLLEERDDDKSEKNLTSYVSQLRQLTQLYFDIMQKISETDNKQTIDIDRVQKQISDIVELVRGIFLELAPQLLPVFIDRLNNKMEEYANEKA